MTQQTIRQLICQVTRRICQLTALDKYGNRNFYVSTVGLDTKKVQEYIRDQEKEDMIQDNLSSKEYNDPFKGN